MAHLAILTLYTLASWWTVSARSAARTNFHSLGVRTRTEGCEQLAATYPFLVSYPNSTTYEEENISFWSESTILSPWCIFTPETAHDVAGGLKILVESQTHFAVRGGGHMPIRGAASTSNGVLIAMDKLSTYQLGSFGDQRVAQLGSGLRWEEVYKWLAPMSLTVVGGRYAPVGLGGFLLGGGVSYYLSARGWGFNHVMNYEMVTADSKILQVNAGSNEDLFWALKGGSTNYGIVTRFDVELFPLTDIYAGFVVQDASNVDRIVQAVADYISAPGGGNFDPKAAIAPNLEFTTDTRLLTAVTSIFYNSSVDSVPRAFENFTSLPNIAPAAPVQRSLLGFLNETVDTGNRNGRKLFGATALKSTAASVNLIADIFLAEVPKLRNVTGGVVTIGFQMIAQSALHAARESGGDAINLDPQDGAIMTVLVSSEYILASDDDYLTDWIDFILTKLDQRSKAEDLFYPFIYLNDAAGGQKPFQLYGKGGSIGRMKAIAAEYDPSGLFQQFCAGSFKLSK